MYNWNQQVKEKFLVFKSKVLGGGQIRDEIVLFIVVCGLLIAVSSSGGAHALGCMGLSSCNSSALEHMPNGCGAQAYFLRSMCDPPRSRIEPVSPALAGNFC